MHLWFDCIESFGRTLNKDEFNKNHTLINCVQLPNNVLVGRTLHCIRSTENNEKKIKAAKLQLHRHLQLDHCPGIWSWGDGENRGCPFHFAAKLQVRWIQQKMYPLNLQLSNKRAYWWQAQQARSSCLLWAKLGLPTNIYGSKNIQGLKTKTNPHHGIWKNPNQGILAICTVVKTWMNTSWFKFWTCNCNTSLSWSTKSKVLLKSSAAFQFDVGQRFDKYIKSSMTANPPKAITIWPVQLSCTHGLAWGCANVGKNCSLYNMGSQTDK